MKKSPLSTPSSSRGKQCYNWKVHDHKSRTEYSYGNDDSYQSVSPNGIQMRTGNDFIPLSISTPVSDQKRHSGNWHGSGGGRNHRNSGSGGFNHYRNNYHATSKSNYNNSYSPYKHSGKQFHAHKKGCYKDARKEIDISRYIDMKSFLEDPWADLTKRLSKSEDTNGKLSNIEQLLSSQSIYNISSKTCSESKSIRDIDDSYPSQESKHDSSVEQALGLDDSDVSELSKTDSSINLKLDSVRFSEESKNESINNSQNNGFDDAEAATDIREFCGTETSTVKASI
ncbi:uncharacterized protein LOC144473482 [Augochlora pura]